MKRRKIITLEVTNGNECYENMCKSGYGAVIFLPGDQAILTFYITASSTFTLSKYDYSQRNVVYIKFRSVSGQGPRSYFESGGADK